MPTNGASEQEDSLEDLSRQLIRAREYAEESRVIAAEYKNFSDKQHYLTRQAFYQQRADDLQARINAISSPTASPEL